MNKVHNLAALAAIVIVGASCVGSAPRSVVAAPNPGPRPQPAAAPSAGIGTLPPARYVTDWYAPPTDWFPQREIRDYTLNTRVPDLFWLKYDGANTLALRIKPIKKEMLEREQAARLISNPSATTFNPSAERDAANRTIGVFGLDVPADDFIAISFKAKNTALRNAGKGLTVMAEGLGVKVTLKDVDKTVRCADGFTAYKVAFPAKAGARLRAVTFTVDAATAADFAQEWVICDFLFRRAAPKARFTDLPQRQWIRTADFLKDPAGLAVSNGIPDVCAYLASAPEGVKTMMLPLKWEDRAAIPNTCDAPSYYKPEHVKETLNGKTYEGVRVTLTMGQSCYLSFPAKFDATEFNTMTFLAKIELPSGLQYRDLEDNYKVTPATPALIGDDYPRFYGSDAMHMNMHFDSFSFGTRSVGYDTDEWPKYGVCQGSVAQHAQRGSALAPKGWRAVAFDALNDLQIGNKSSFSAKVTHWCFYYNTRKIPAGQKIIVTLLAPQVSSGVMLAGGDMAAYAEFLKARAAWKPDYSDSRALLEAPAAGRLAKPLPFVRNHKPAGEIVVAYGTPAPRYRRIVDRAVERLNEIFAEKYGLTTNFVVRTAPSAERNVKLFLGGDAYSRVNAKQYDADMKAIAGTDGFAVRTAGNNVYIYAAPFNYVGNGRGLANGLYTWIMNNTDVVYTGDKDNAARFVCDPAPDGNMSIVWGDSVQVSPLAARSASGEFNFADFMRASRDSVWADPSLGGLRPRSTNHWWGYGTEKNMDGSEPAKGQLPDTCGLNREGKRMRPGCYTGHPCLVNVLENAKAAYVNAAFSPSTGESGYGVGDAKWMKIPFAPEPDCSFRNFDIMGLWVEDSQTLCQCEKCRTPIRLPDGTLVRRPTSAHSMGEGEFLSNQFYANGCAMINQVNVYARRDMRVESIAYFWMAEPPQFNISRNYNVRFCPYVRKDYMEPVFSPANDPWYRNLRRWGQLDCHLAMYDYALLFQNAHPVADVFKLDIGAELTHCRLEEMYFETGSNFLPDYLERWTVSQLEWDPTADVMALRKQYIRRAFREAAPDMEKFFFTIYAACYQAGSSFKIDFESEGSSALILRNLPAADGKGGTRFDECTRHLDDALRNVRNPKSKILVERWRTGWEKLRKSLGI